MKRVVRTLLIAALCLPSALWASPINYFAPIWGQSLNYTPRAQAAYVNLGAGWVPWTNGADFGQIDYQPYAVGLYCQSAANGPWSPCLPGSGSGNGSNPAIPSGALADYRFLDGTGTTVKDGTNNHNDATLCSSGCTAPTWIPNGLNFGNESAVNKTAGVSLPAALNASQTFLFVAYQNPIQTALFPVNYSTLLTNSTAGAQFNILTSYVNADGAFEGGYGVATFVNATTNNYATNGYSGLHAIAMVCGSGSGTVDHLYIDGIEVNYGKVQGTSCGAQTSGNLYIGNSGTAPWLTQGELNGTMYRAIFWPTKLTSAQVKAASFAALQEANSRGIQPGPQIPWNIGTFLIHFIGDSITAGFGVTTPYPSLVGAINGQTATVKNWGVNSLSARQISLSEQDRVAPQCRSISGVSPVAVVFAGTNDWIGPSPTQTGIKIWNSLQSEIATLKVAGCKVFVATMLSRSGNGTNGISNDVNKNALDLQISGNWKEAGATGLIDFANNPLLGADGASANTTYFQVDAIHPNQTGANLLASIATSVLNYYYSPYSIGSPHVYTASATLASADVAVSTGTLSATTALVMPDCSGLTGTTFAITNNQAAQTVTIAGGASQPINGLTSAITVVANSTVRLTAQANPYTTSGCRWAM